MNIKYVEPKYQGYKFQKLCEFVSCEIVNCDLVNLWIVFDQTLKDSSSI